MTSSNPVPVLPAARRLRVLVITTWFPSTERPTEAPFNLKHAEAIALTHDVRVVHVRLKSIKPQQLEEYAGFRVQRLSFSLRRPWQVFQVLGAVRSASKIADLVHTMAFSTALLTWPAQMFIGRARPPWVHTEHWNGVLNPASVSAVWVRLAWLRRVLAKPDWLTGVTTQLADTLSGFGRPDSTSVVPCVVDNPLPVLPRPASATLRLVAVGGLVERKRPLMAVQTIKYLVDAGCDVSMTWIGDGPHRNAVEAECIRLGVAERFYLAGSVDPDEVFKYFQDADLFFLPTSQENFFTSAAEALSAGRPVVAAQVGGFYDYADASNSILVANASPETFGEAILTARLRFANESADQIAAPIRLRFSLEEIGAQFDEIYRRLRMRRGREND